MRFGRSLRRITSALIANSQFFDTVQIVYNDIGYNDEPDITTEL